MGFRAGLIVCDLDGTLLRRGGVISRRSVRTLLACRRMGLPFVVATARSRYSVDTVLADVLPPDGQITSGGALAYVGTEQIFSRLMGEEDCDALTAALVALRGEGLVEQISLHSPSGDFSNVPYVAPERLLHNHCYTDFSQPLHLPAMSVSAVIRQREVLEGLKADFSHLHIISYRGEKLHRFAHPEANKGTALLAVCEKMGLDAATALAFGDDVNDRELFEVAGRSVACLSGHPEVLTLADDTCLSPGQDGVARYLRKHVTGSLWARLRDFPKNKKKSIEKQSEKNEENSHE